MKSYKIYLYISICVVHSYGCIKIGSNDNDSNSAFIKTWENIYEIEKSNFKGKTPYKARDYFGNLFFNFEKTVDHLEENYFTIDNKDALVAEVYDSLPKDYITWDAEMVQGFFSDIENENELTIRVLSFKTLVLHRLWDSYKSSSFDVNSLKPRFVKHSKDGNFGELILEARNYDYPVIAVVNDDTLPYLEDGLTPYLNQKYFIGRKAQLFYITSEDTLSFEIDLE